MTGAALVYVAAWTTTGLGALQALPTVVKLAMGRARGQLTRSEAWRKAGSDLLPALLILSCGLVLFEPLNSRSSLAWRLPSALVAVVACWNIFCDRQSRRKWTPDGDPAEAASEPDTSPGRERRRRPALPLPAAGASANEIAEWVDRIVFSTTRRPPGYDEEEVDVLLDTIRDTFLGVREVPLTPDEIAGIRFTKTRLRPGYVEADVDNFLEQVRVRLAL
jgi:DivIVA domain-containing protein